MYSVKVFNKISQKGLEYLNSLNFSSDENIDDPDISKYYFDNLLTEKNEILDKTDF